jgi:hypothetical protein
MPLLILKELRCGNCDTPTLHRDSHLRQIMQLLSFEYEDATWINFACLDCKHSVPDEMRSISEEDELALLGDVVDYAISLECAKTDCAIPVWLLTRKPRHKDDPWLTEQILSRLVDTRQAVCRSGFRPMNPLGMRIWEEMPLRSFAPPEPR